MKMIGTNDFCIVVSDKKLKNSGLKRGDVVMVAGVKPAPIKKSDPYLQRIFVVGLRFDGDNLQVPKEDNDFLAYLIDPRNLEKLPDEEQLILVEKINKQYGYYDDTPD